MKVSSVLKIVFAAALAAAVALIAAGKSLDSDRYHRFLAEQVKAATGLELTLSGPVKLKLSLNPQLSFTGLGLASGGGGAPLLFIDRIEARVALLPLMFHRLQIEQIRLIRPTLRLDGPIRLNGGKASAIDLTQGGDKVPATSFSPAEIRIDNATILRRSSPRAAETRITVAHGRIQPESIAGGPLNLQADGSWDGTGFDMAGIVGPLAALLAGKPYQVQVKGTIHGVVVMARGTVAEPLAGRGFDLEVRAQGDELAELLRRADPNPASRPIPPIGPYKLAARLTDAGGSIGLSDIDAVLGRRDGLLLGAKGAIRDLAGGGGIDLALTVEADGLGGLSRLIGVELPTAGPFRLSGHLSEAEAGWRLTGLKSTLGRSDFSGELALALSPRPRFFGRLSAATFVPGELSFPVAKAADPARPAPLRPSIPIADGRVLSPEPLPLEPLRGFDLDLSLAAARLVLGPAALTDAVAGIHLSSGKLAIDQFTARMGDGTVRGEAHLDLAARVPAVTLRLNGEGVDFGRLAGDPGSAGHGDFTIDAKAQGNTPRALAGSLEGSVTAAIADAAVTKTIGGEVSSGVIAALDAGRLRCAALRLSAKGGLINADRGFAAEAGQEAVLGSGTVDLRAETIDLSFVARSGGITRLRGPLGAPTLSVEAPAPLPRGAPSRGVGRTVPDASPCRTVAASRRR